MTVIRIIKTVVFLLFPILTISPLLVVAEERVLGLLTLPQVFGNGACDRFEAETITVYKRPKKLTLLPQFKLKNSGNFQ